MLTFPTTLFANSNTATLTFLQSETVQIATQSSYTFTAVATTLSPGLTSDASGPSNAVTPTTPAGGVTVSGTSPTSGASTMTTPRVLPLRIASSSTSAAAITTTFTAPATGTAVQIATTSASRRISRTGSIKVCSVQAAVAVAGSTTLVCRLTNAARRARLNRDLRVTLTTTFTQQDGAQLTLRAAAGTRDYNVGEPPEPAVVAVAQTLGLQLRPDFVARHSDAAVRPSRAGLPALGA
jgi:hypothetical protein